MEEKKLLSNRTDKFTILVLNEKCLKKVRLQENCKTANFKLCKKGGDG
jgi:hypothetical protein